MYPFARQPVFPFHRSYLWRESSTTQGAPRAPAASSMSPSVYVSSHEKKPCCHSQPLSSSSASVMAARTGASTTHKSPIKHSPDLALSSVQFWSDLRIWSTASVNTFRCLVGCTLGDMSMLFYLQSAHPTLSPAIAMGLAMTSGILTSISLETVLLRFSRASNMSWKAAFKTATGMSLISMLTMEAVENAVDYHLMGWGNVDVTDPLFWKAVGWSALAGWSAPLPFNYWNLKRHGKSCH
ncbi:MAG: hypothetical protein J3Q66DRAFT_100291 [Benniella sp.]|nr:MAG: hypothetical protein J3Q66DRAFT_100291 [Benniella sp.]